MAVIPSGDCTLTIQSEVTCKPIIFAGTHMICREPYRLFEMIFINDEITLFNFDIIRI